MVIAFKVLTPSYVVGCESNDPKHKVAARQKRFARYKKRHSWGRLISSAGQERRESHSYTSLLSPLHLGSNSRIMTTSSLKRPSLDRQNLHPPSRGAWIHPSSPPLCDKLQNCESGPSLCCLLLGQQNYRQSQGSVRVSLIPAQGGTATSPAGWKDPMKTRQNGQRGGFLETWQSLRAQSTHSLWLHPEMPTFTISSRQMPQSQSSSS